MPLNRLSSFTSSIEIVAIGEEILQLAFTRDIFSPVLESMENGLDLPLRSISSVSNPRDSSLWKKRFQYRKVGFPLSHSCQSPLNQSLSERRG